MSSQLEGKYVIMHQGDAFRTGKILERASPYIYLIEFDSSGKTPVPPLELYAVDEMLDADDSGFKQWSFFKDRESMQEFSAWLEEPGTTEEAKPNGVVAFKKPSKKAPN